MNTLGAARSLLLYAVLLLVVYSIPFNSQVTLNAHHVAGMRLDHLLHVLLFLPVPVVVRRTVRAYPFRTIALLLATAVLIEGMHLVIPQRAFSVYDILANVAGIVLGATAVLLTKR